jgi:hypothetical protein
MKRMPIAGAAMIMLAVFFFALGAVGLVFRETALRPGPVYPFGPSQAFWGQSPAAIFVALGCGAAWIGWMFFQSRRSDRRSTRRHRCPLCGQLANRLTALVRGVSKFWLKTNSAGWAAKKKAGTQRGTLR